MPAENVAIRDSAESPTFIERLKTYGRSEAEANRQIAATKAESAT
jgi:hypothetical protein